MLPEIRNKINVLEASLEQPDAYERMKTVIPELNVALNEFIDVINLPEKFDMDTLIGEWYSKQRKETIKIHKKENSYFLTTYERNWFWQPLKPITSKIMVKESGELEITIGYFYERLEYDYFTDGLIVSYLGRFDRKPIKNTQDE